MIKSVKKLRILQQWKTQFDHSKIKPKDQHLSVFKSPADTGDHKYVDNLDNRHVARN